MSGREAGEVRLDCYTVVLLKRPKDAPTFTAEELDRLQRQHLDQLASLYGRGMVASSPGTPPPGS